MEYKEFLEAVKDKLQNRFGKGADIRVEQVFKNNGIVLDALIIREFGKRISPCIYLDGIYRSYSVGDMDLDTVEDYILGVFKEKNLDIHFDVEEFSDFEKIKNNLQGRMVNTELNHELLEKIPHREFLDLSIIYCVDVRGLGEHNASVKINNQHMKAWNVQESDLFEQMIINMEKDEGYLATISDVIREYLAPENAETFQMADQEMMYILSNKEKAFGSIKILDQQLLKKAASILGRNFYLLPSSVHESILVKEDDDTNPNELAEMVAEVNEIAVEAEDILSYHVYRYDSLTGTLTIAA